MRGKIFDFFIFFTMLPTITAQKWSFSLRIFLSKCDQIHKKLRIWSHLLDILCAFFVQRNIPGYSKLTGRWTCSSFLWFLCNDSNFLTEFCWAHANRVYKNHSFLRGPSHPHFNLFRFHILPSQIKCCRSTLIQFLPFSCYGL